MGAAHGSSLVSWSRQQALPAGRQVDSHQQALIGGMVFPHLSRIGMGAAHGSAQLGQVEAASIHSCSLRRLHDAELQDFDSCGQRDMPA